ncbi:MAG: hypothetical protein A2289_17845 [Deltaproteobacteria bacterium RIFOXYA12_FULL_58_15]|nr:MAG: hypothetical protein A2289_17845 [Deltaproteobacteria bacterium RIFOXYA12_FULL_58_15]OGR12489.1 MAG: hypothetical protein A2341_19820 [Deltaproteobacteria bacterium RIFOXYB12_FULL_58_9]
MAPPADTMHRFAEYLKRRAALPGAVISSLDIDGIVAALSVAELPQAPMGYLRALVDAWVDYAEIEAMDASLVDTATLPACAAAMNNDVDCIGVLEQTVRTIIDRGTVCGRAARKNHPGLDAYGAHIDHIEDLDGISAHRWLALERGEKDGVLKMELRWPEDLAPPDWATSMLSDAVKGTLHRRARSDAAWAGADVLEDLLTTPAREERLLAVARTAGKIGVVAMQADGKVFASSSTVVGDVAPLLKARIAEHGVSLVAGPASGLDVIGMGLPCEVVIVRDVALHQAASDLSGPRVESLARVIGERVQRPRQAWERLDPTTLGLVEYQQNLSSDYVRLVLSMARARARQRPTRVEAPKSSPRLSLAKSIADLKVGLVVDGVVTQIAPFGAFVNIGVGRAGLVHISELADARVERPTDVVHVGQRVVVRIIGVDLEQGKISLSLRTKSDRSGNSHSGSKRKQALDALGKLFK